MGQGFDEFKDKEKFFGAPINKMGMRPLEDKRNRMLPSFEDEMKDEVLRRRRFDERYEKYKSRFPPKSDQDYDSNRGRRKNLSYGVKFEVENEKIRKLDEEIERDLDIISRDAGVLKKERDFQNILMKMLEMEKNKILMIEEVLREHREKEIDVEKGIERIKKMLKSAKVEKIGHLENLQSLAEKKRNEALSEMEDGYYPTRNIEGLLNEKVDYLSNFDEIEHRSNFDEIDNRSSRRNFDEIEHQRNFDENLSKFNHAKWIDKSLYDKLPLKRITSMKKLKSILVRLSLYFSFPSLFGKGWWWVGGGAGGGEG